jgi:hypothetical protein
MGVMGAVIAVSVSDVIYGVIITHDAWTRFKVGSFLPLGAIVKMSLASLIMAVVVYAMGFVFPVVNVVSLAVAMTIGVVVYLCGLRILQVFNDTDRRMVESSSLPLKGLLLRLLWKAK